MLACFVFKSVSCENVEHLKVKLALSLTFTM